LLLINFVKNVQK